MAMFMENYRKQQAVIEEGSRDKYSNFFAEAYQVSEDIDLQIMMSEMTVELRDVLYSETDGKEKVGFGTKVKNFIKSIYELIKRAIRFITNFFKRNKKEDAKMAEEKKKYKDIMDLLEKVLEKLSNAEVSEESAHKLMYPMNKVSTFLKFLIYDTIILDKTHELAESISNLLNNKGELERSVIIGSDEYKNIYKSKISDSEKRKALSKYMLNNSPNIAKLIDNFKANNSSIHLKIAVMQITEDVIKPQYMPPNGKFNTIQIMQSLLSIIATEHYFHTTFNAFDSGFENVNKILSDEELNNIINFINGVLDTFKPNEDVLWASKVMPEDVNYLISKDNKKFRDDIVSMLGLDSKDASKITTIDEILKYIDTNVSDEAFDEIFVPMLIGQGYRYVPSDEE